LGAIQLLLEAGADPNIAMYEGQSPLTKLTAVDVWTDEDQAIEAAQEFLNHGADVNHQTAKGRTALHFAIEANRLKLARFLLEQGAKPNVQDQTGATPLRLAACTGSQKAIQLLLEAGADPSLATYRGQTVLTKLTSVDVWTDEDQAIEAAQEFLNHGADVNHQTITGYTALYFAIDANRLKLARLFLEKGARPNMRGKNKKTPLDIAMEKNLSEAVALLLEFQ
jgi:ankyrin repeat protein